MLLAGVNGNLKDAAERNDVFGESISKDDFIHSAFSINPQFGVLTGGGPRLTDSNGVPWQGSYVNANSDLTVDLRSDIAAESRAKIVSNHSTGEDARGPWNEGESTGLGEEWLYVEDPREQVLETDGLTQLKPQGTPRTEASVRSADKKLSKERSGEIRKATPEKNLRWCEYEPQDPKASRRQPVEQD